ncbi:MAG: TIGR00341 family protein [Thermoplasmata archaeon]|nr:MAG: TIGR00341 family protein [Thermoplasmata archaeon]
MYRLLLVYHPCNESIDEILKKFDVEIWKEKHGKQCFARILLQAEKSEEVINALERHFSKYESFRIIILPVEAKIPREESNEKEEKKEKEKERLSTEEIYEDLTEEAKLSSAYLALVILAAITASIGILYNNVAIIIGSMVIAPLLAPNMALALAATLADSKLAKRSMTTGFIGYIAAILTGFIFGLLFKNEISLQNLGHLYLLLAFAAGIAGAISITKGIIETLVGVMVAVALLPPIVAAGILLGQGCFLKAIGSLLVFSINVVGINLAAILTFLAQGISPRTWWEKKKAKKTSWLFVTIWLLIMLALVILIYFYERI